MLKFCRAYLLEKHKNTRISQFTKPTTSTNILNFNSNTLNFNMDTLFHEFSELMDDANDKMPEGTYLALYDKLKELKDKVSESPGYVSITEREIAHLKFELTLANHRAAVIRKGDLDKIKELQEKAHRLADQARTAWRPRCRCGSTDHLKTNFLGCRLNKRVLAGVLGTAARDRALAETAALANPPTEV